ncbi:IclR family transcriptional regulator [Homoserinimonas sp. A447]
MGEEPSWLIQSVERAAAILGLYSIDKASWTEQEIVAATGLTRGTVYRQTQTLRRLGYLVASGSGRYRLGLRAVTLGQVALRSLDVAELATPALIKLRDETGYTVSLTTLDDKDIVYVAQVRGTSLMDLRAEVGSRRPAFCTSMGRAMLSCLSDSEIESFLNATTYEAFTVRTVTDREELREAIMRVRDNGYAVNDGELELGLRGIAAPIRYINNRPAAAVNVALSSQAPVREFEERVAPLVLKAAASVTQILADSASSTVY